MTRTIRILGMSAAVLALSASTILAKPSVRYMRPSGLGIEYSFLARGQAITKAETPSHEIMHLAMLYYSPTEIVQFGLGGGVDRMRVDEYNNTQFKGGYGFSPVFGVWLNTPSFIKKVVRITAGFTYLHLNSADDDYRYSGPILNPNVGLLFHAGRFLDLEAGVKGHFIAGTMKNEDAGRSTEFSNGSNVRGYGAITLCAPIGAFATLNFDASPDVSSNWGNGPSEASLGFSVGTNLFPFPKTQHSKAINNSKAFPEYNNLKKRQRAMAREIED